MPWKLIFRSVSSIYDVIFIITIISFRQGWDCYQTQQVKPRHCWSWVRPKHPPDLADIFDMKIIQNVTLFIVFFERVIFVLFYYKLKWLFMYFFFHILSHFLHESAILLSLTCNVNQYFMFPLPVRSEGRQPYTLLCEGKSPQSRPQCSGGCCWGHWRVWSTQRVGDIAWFSWLIASIYVRGGGI